MFNSIFLNHHIDPYSHRPEIGKVNIPTNSMMKTSPSDDYDFLGTPEGPLSAAICESRLHQLHGVRLLHGRLSLGALAPVVPQLPWHRGFRQNAGNLRETQGGQQLELRKK